MKLLILFAALLTACGDNYVPAAAINKAKELCAPSELNFIREDWANATRAVRWYEAHCSTHNIRFSEPSK